MQTKACVNEAVLRRCVRWPHVPWPHLSGPKLRNDPLESALVHNAGADSGTGAGANPPDAACILRAAAKWIARTPSFAGTKQKTLLENSGSAPAHRGFAFRNRQTARRSP